jgi:hypothetical protein
VHDLAIIVASTKEDERPRMSLANGGSIGVKRLGDSGEWSPAIRPVPSVLRMSALEPS